MAPSRDEQVDGKNAFRTKKWRRNKNCAVSWTLRSGDWKRGQWQEFQRLLFCFPLNCHFFSALGNIDLKLKLVKHMHFFDVLEKCNVPKGKGTHCSRNYPLFASLTVTSLEWEIARCFQPSQTQIYFSQIAELEKPAYVPVLLKVGSGCSLL